MRARVRIDAAAIETARGMGPHQIVVPAEVLRPCEDVLIARGHRVVDPGTARVSPIRLMPVSKVPRLADRLAVAPGRNAAVTGLCADVWLTGSDVTVDCFVGGLPAAGGLTTTRLEHVIVARTGRNGDSPPTPRSTASYNPRLGVALGQLVVGVVGLGRQGALLLTSLLPTGISRFVVCDADSFDHDGGSEDGHLLARGNRGRPKVDAALHFVQGLGGEIRTVDMPLESTEAVRALADVDILIYAADLPATAVRCYALAMTLGTPCFILGAGLSPARQTVGSVRMLLPGDGCLACLGGVPMAASRTRGEVTTPILMEQAAAATRLLQRLVAGREKASTIIELHERDGVVSGTRVAPSRDGRCAVCAGGGHE